MKNAVVLLLALTSSFAMADVWKDLRNTEASQYDIGRAFIAMSTTELTQTFEGERIDDFKFYKANLIDNGALGIQMAYSARSKYLEKAQCQVLQNVTERLINKPALVKAIWPSVTPEQQNTIINNFILQTVMVDKDNPSLSVACN